MLVSGFSAGAQNMNFWSGHNRAWESTWKSNSRIALGRGIITILFRGRWHRHLWNPMLRNNGMR